MHGCFVFQDRMEEVETIELPGGAAVVYTNPCPDLDQPNEDGALVVLRDDGSCVLAVADGMGGAKAGATASRIVLDALAEAVQQFDPDELSLRGAILSAMEGANEAIRSIGVGAATTLVVAELRDNVLRPYHIGDSQLFVIGQRGKIKRRTVAHSPSSYAVEAGVIEPDEAIERADRHLVSNVVGSEDMRIEVGSPLRLSPRDTLVLATDGLCDNLREDEIVETVRKGKLVRAADRLREVGLRRMRAPEEGEPSKPDDMTLILYRRTRS